MQKLSPYELTQNPFTLIHRQWAMITTRNEEKTNTMTASWGGMGILWNKPVVYIFLRPQRFTREIMDSTDLFSVCFLEEKYRDKMIYCGKASGRDGDKLDICGFTSTTLDEAPVLLQSELALTCKKLYRQQLDPGCLIDGTLDESNYPNKDYHYLYVAEILGAYTELSK